MIIYKDYKTFNIFQTEVNIISNETSYGISTVAEIDEVYYYLDSDLPTVASAIFAWQQIKDITLSSEDIQDIMLENKSFAV